MHERLLKALQAQLPPLACLFLVFAAIPATSSPWTGAPHPLEKALSQARGANEVTDVPSKLLLVGALGHQVTLPCGSVMGNGGGSDWGRPQYPAEHVVMLQG